jgi:hypothetical protein
MRIAGKVQFSFRPDRREEWAASEVNQSSAEVTFIERHFPATLFESLV